MRPFRIDPLALAWAGAFSALAHAAAPSPSPIAPSGLLPRPAARVERPMAETVVASRGPSRTVRFEDLGLAVDVPREWMDKAAGALRQIGPPEARPVLEVGHVTGVGAGVRAASRDLTQILRSDGLTGARVRDNVIGANTFVFVAGGGLDACQYAYLPARTAVIAFRIAPALCSADGRLTPLAIGVLRSVRLSLPSR